MSDDQFSTENRKSAWFATDSRRSVSGKLVDVIAEKIGDKERDNLDFVEEVQMGKKMEPYIGRLFEDETGIRARSLDVLGIHPTETWIRAHTDFETSDGGLLETKNYNAAIFNQYPDMGEDGTPALPAPDLIQCIHEACVFNKPHVWFCALFGGQRLRYWKIIVTDDMKADFIKQASQWWAYVQTRSYPTPETVDQARMVYGVSSDEAVIADAMTEIVVERLKALKSELKKFEALEEAALVHLQNTMKDRGTLLSPAGEILATWKSAKPTMRFSSSLFQQAMPDVYEKFVVETKGSRRFLLK
jgi:predicted phage-related endonuclease